MMFNIKNTISATIRTAATISAARKIFVLGLNEYVPSEVSIICAFERTAAPIAGPIIPGTRT